MKELNQTEENKTRIPKDVLDYIGQSESFSLDDLTKLSGCGVVDAFKWIKILVEKGCVAEKKSGVFALNVSAQELKTACEGIVENYNEDEMPELDEDSSDVDFDDDDPLGLDRDCDDPLGLDIDFDDDDPLGLDSDDDDLPYSGSNSDSPAAPDSNKAHDEYVEDDENLLDPDKIVHFNDLYLNHALYLRRGMYMLFKSNGETLAVAENFRYATLNKALNSAVSDGRMIDVIRFFGFKNDLLAVDFLQIFDIEPSRFLKAAYIVVDENKKVPIAPYSVLSVEAPAAFYTALKKGHAITFEVEMDTKRCLRELKRHKKIDCEIVSPNGNALKSIVVLNCGVEYVYSDVDRKNNKEAITKFFGKEIDKKNELCMFDLVDTVSVEVGGKKKVLSRKPIYDQLNEEEFNELESSEIIRFYVTFRDEV